MMVIRKAVEALSVVLLGALVAVPFIQVVMRDAFGAPIVGAEELTRFLLICLVFVALPLVVAAGENIVMGEFREALPDKPRRVLKLAIAILGILASAFVAYATWVTILANLNNSTPTLKIPFWLFLGATLFGFCGVVIVGLLQRRRARPTNGNVRH
ncbi:TRAP transporter small permease [Pelagibius litoralis]|uniref:TRAP transporter small permease protein n=1 Tax=Pelagibius litoralis TaxID=374515 RepID=A0A967EYQ2_9PROT|nr:TRAP transporter small permease [Pelagibius litoralis]